jgi:hypothetical protein
MYCKCIANIRIILVKWWECLGKLLTVFFVKPAVVRGLGVFGYVDSIFVGFFSLVFIVGAIVAIIGGASIAMFSKKY